MTADMYLYHTIIHISALIYRQHHESTATKGC